MQIKKGVKIGELNEQYLMRERIRQEKQKVHNEYIANLEICKTSISEREKERDNLIISKRDLKKDLDVAKTTLSTLYIKILRQGLDIREEGLRWVIKCL